MSKYLDTLRHGKLLMIAVSTFATSATLADEVDMFSRANCANNESITYNFFDPPQWRLTFSTHVDTQAGNSSHYVASGPLAYCDIFGCWYYYEYTTRAAAIHWGEGGVPGFSSRWVVYGDHRHYYPGVGFTHFPTSAVDCNLSFDQFG